MLNLSQFSYTPLHAVATAAVDMTNTTIECLSGNIALVSIIGNISLCIVGEF